VSETSAQNTSESAVI